MNLQELSSPIRMYWDIGPSSVVSPEDCRRIAGEIAANKFLALQVTETAPVISEPCLAILDTLKDKPLALSLVAPLAALDERAMERIGSSSLKVLFAQTDVIGELGRIAELAKKTGGRPAVGLSFPVTRENFRELPGVLRGCVNGQIPHLLLPMQRLMTGVECFTFSRREREALTEELRQIAKPPQLKITIHDPFLWRAFYPEVEFPNGGCQAANTMLYLSPDAVVYPCPTVPLKLGDLRKETLKEVVSSEGKKRVRKELLAAAPPCADCAAYTECKGGCRGRAYIQSSSFAQHDPSCK